MSNFRWSFVEGRKLLCRAPGWEVIGLITYAKEQLQCKNLV